MPRICKACCPVGLGCTPRSAFSRSLVILPLLCVVAQAVRSVENLDEISIEAAATATTSGKRWVVSGHYEDCQATANKGWNLGEAFELETMADPSVFYLYSEQSLHNVAPCRMGIKVLTQEGSWKGAWGSKSSTMKAWGDMGELTMGGNGNIEIPADVAATGFRLMINERTGKWAWSRLDYYDAFRVEFPSFDQLGQWHNNPFENSMASCYSPTEKKDIPISPATGPFKALPMATMRLIPSNGENLDGIKSGSIESLTGTLLYDGIIDGVPVSWTYYGVEAATVGATGAKGKQKKSLKLKFRASSTEQRRQAERPLSTDPYFLGEERVSLRANANDCSLVRELLMTDLYYAMCVPAYRQIPVQLFIGDDYYSVFLMTEWFDANFVARAFGRDLRQGDRLIDMGYGETFEKLMPTKGEAHDYYGLGYHNKDGGRCAGSSKEVDDSGLCRVSYDNREATFIPNDFSAAIPDKAERASLGNLMNSIDVVGEVNYDDLKGAIDIDRVLRAMAVDLTTGQWDDFYRNYNNFFLFREVNSNDYPFYYLIPFDCDWAFHRRAFFDEGKKDIVGLGKKWDDFCCIPNADFPKGGSRLIAAIKRNVALKTQLIDHIMHVLRTYMLPASSGSTRAREVGVLLARNEQMYAILQTHTRDPFYGTCYNMMKVDGKSKYDDYKEIEKFVQTKYCQLLKQMMHTHLQELATGLTRQHCR